MKENITTKKIDVPVIEGSEPIAIATVCVDTKGNGAIAFSALEGVNLINVGNSFIDFGKKLLDENSVKVEKEGKGNGKA